MWTLRKQQGWGVGGMAQRVSGWADIETQQPGSASVLLTITLLPAALSEIQPALVQASVAGPQLATGTPSKDNSFSL